MSDLRDERQGAYDPVSENDKRPAGKLTRHQAAQQGASVRLEPDDGGGPPGEGSGAKDRKSDLPSGLERERKGP